MNTKLAYCHVVASVLAADGVIEEAERQFLDRIMTDMNLSDEERDQVMHFEGTDGAVETVRELPALAREQLRDDVLAATLIDGKISPHESRLVSLITEALGL